MADLRIVAQHAESTGIDSLWFPEHVVFFREYRSRYPYSADGNPGFGRRQGVYDPLFACTVAATVTTKIRVGTSILILPQRNPIVLAQEVVAVDHASDGRFDLGIGIGWSSEEFDAVGVPWAQRGARTDEYLDVMKTLWRDEVADHRGPLLNFDNVIAEPKPVQNPHPPIWIGGGRGAPMRRAATHGDGWYGWAIATQEIAETMAELDRACEAAKRDPSTVGRKLGLPFGGSSDELKVYLDAAQRANVEEVVVSTGIGTDFLRQRMDELAMIDR